MEVDVFLCHAADDKDSFVRPLAIALAQRGLSVWFDEFSLRPGDSIRQSIDRGLSAARYCLVVLSPRFFGRAWPAWELDAIVQRHLESASPLLIPIWLDMEAPDVRRHSPALSNVLAIRAAGGVASVADQVAAIASDIRLAAFGRAVDDLLERTLELIGKALVRSYGKMLIWISARDGNNDSQPVAAVEFEGQKVRYLSHVTYHVREVNSLRWPSGSGRICSMITIPLFQTSGDVFGLLGIVSTVEIPSQSPSLRQLEAAVRSASPALQPLVASRMTRIQESGELP